MAKSATRVASTCATPGCEAPKDTMLTAKLLFLLPTVAAALKVVGFRRTYATLGRASARGLGRPASGSNRSPEQVAKLVVHVNRHVLPYQSKCLLESMTLWYLLRRGGYPAELFLGARTLLGPLESHAWVELQGAVLNDAENVRDIYEPFPMAPGSSATRSP